MRLSNISFLAKAIIAAGGGGSLSIVQQPSKVEQGFGSTVQRTLSAVGSGNSLVVVANGWASGGTPTITDSAGNTWATPVFSYTHVAEDAQSHFFILNNITNAPTWVQANYGGGIECRIGAVEVSGGALSVDATYSGTQSSATQWDSAFNSTEDNTLFIGMAAMSNFATATGISPITADSTAEYFAYYRGLFPTAGSNTASFTLNDSRSGSKAGIIVKVA